MAKFPFPFASDRAQTSIDLAPEHAAALGRLLGHWAMFDRLLIGILKYLLTIDWGKAMLVYQEFGSTKSKIVLMRRLNHYYTEDEDLKIDVDKLLSQALKLNTKRNAFIHAMWTGTPSHFYRQKVMPPPDHKKTIHDIEPFTLQDIQNVVEEIAELSQSLRYLLLQFQAELTKPPQE